MENDIDDSDITESEDLSSDLSGDTADVSSDSFVDKIPEDEEIVDVDDSSDILSNTDDDALDSESEAVNDEIPEDEEPVDVDDSSDLTSDSAVDSLNTESDTSSFIDEIPEDEEILDVNQQDAQDLNEIGTEESGDVQDTDNLDSSENQDLTNVAEDSPADDMQPTVPEENVELLEAGDSINNDTVSPSISDTEAVNNNEEFADVPEDVNDIESAQPETSTDVQNDDYSNIPEDTDSITPGADTHVTNAYTDEPESYQNLYNYMTDHNYGLQDEGTYKNDPEWQQLNNNYLQDLGKDPIDYTDQSKTSGTDSYQNLYNYMTDHDYGLQDEGTYKNDPEWQQLNSEYLADLQKSPVPQSDVSEVDTGTADHPTDIETAQNNPDNKDISNISDIPNWLSDINPKYDPYDIDSPYSNNCGSCAYAVYRRLEGDNDISATDKNIPYNSDMNALTGMEQVSMSPDEIAQRLLEQGDGAHAIIGIDRAEGPGHWFNAANINGKVVAIDGQSGEINDWPPDYGDVVNWEMSVKKGD